MSKGSEAQRFRNAVRLTAASEARTVAATGPCRLAPQGHYPEEVHLAFPSSRRSIPRPPRLGFVLAVGQHAFVNSTGSPARPVELGDESGKLLSGEYLIDGVEVEVLAWRPRGPSDTRYRVRGPDGADGWVPAGNLRRSFVPPPSPASPTAAQAAVPADSNGRPFGQRSHTGLHSPPPLTSPAPSAANGGRRFGKRF